MTTNQTSKYTLNQVVNLTRSEVVNLNRSRVVSLNRSEVVNYSRFLQLGPEGTLGNIGVNNLALNLIYDANNTFLPSSGLVHTNIFRVTTCPSSFHDGIVTTTNKLIQAQSTASNLPPNDCRTIVTNPPSFTNTFNCVANTNPFVDDIHNIDYNLAMLVAEDQIQYEDFEDGARRMDEELIYNWLDRNDSIRLSSPVLDSFYLNRYPQSIGNINHLENQIQLLQDSTIIADSALWFSKLILAKQLNANLGSQIIFESNTKWVNEKYFEVLENGVKSINEEDEGILEQLSNTCPYIGGNAVYRAREIIGQLNTGIHYDDLYICNSQGMYKNGSSKLDQQLKLIEESKKHHLLEEKGLIIYPNPATTEITLSYLLGENESAVFEIFDMLGNKLFETVIPKGSCRHLENFGSLAAGIYSYQFRTSRGNIYIGKLTIE